MILANTEKSPLKIKETLMRSHSLSLAKREVHPLQFELLVPRSEMYESIRLLRDKAIKIFPSVSKVFRLFDEACIPVNREDPLLDVKIMAQGLLVKHKRILTTTPKEIVGFGFLLPTNRLAYMALATYPKSVFVHNRRIEVPFDGNAVWSGLIETFATRCADCKSSCENCIESHELSCELLQEAERMGILQEVRDHTDYWMTRNSQSLIDLSANICSGCVV